MIRENQKYFNGLQVLLDLIIIYLSFLIAFYIRFYILNGHQVYSLSTYLKIITGLVPLYLIGYNWFDLYTSRRIKQFSSECFIILSCHLFVILILTLFLFTGKDRTQDFSRGLIGIYAMLNAIFTISYRGIIRFLLGRYRKKGYNLKHCLIIGTSNVASNLVHKIKTHPSWGYNIVGCLSTYFTAQNTFCSYRILGDINELETILTDYNVDIVMIATDENEALHLGSIINDCEKAGVKTHIIPYYHKYVHSRPYMDDLDGLPIIDTRHVPLDNFFKAFCKRLFDIFFSIFAIILCSPLLIFSAIMVKLSSKGPILYKQERVGLNRKNFYMYKFRSMKVQASDEEISKWTTKDDPRKTRWGTIMRKLSIDELPQFFNVLKGDMSVIGPRPERPYFVDKFKEEIPHYMIKHQVRPGITGWAQVNGLRGDTSIEDRIEYDLYYIENWSFILDIKIVFLTILHGFINKNAY